MVERPLSQYQAVTLRHSLDVSHCPRHAALVLMLAFLAMPVDSVAGSETPAGPSPNALFQFQKDNRSHPWLHITADSGMVERKVLRLDPIGLHGMSAPDGVQVEGSLTWSRIQRIDEVVTRAGAWGKVGAVTLGLLGAGLGNALGAPTHSGGRLALPSLPTWMRHRTPGSLV